MAATSADNNSNSSRRRLSVFKDVTAIKNGFYWAQPLGVFKAIIFFPSLVFTGLFTTVQEEVLLNLKTALDQKDLVGIKYKIKTVKELELTQPLDQYLKWIDKRGQTINPEDGTFFKDLLRQLKFSLTDFGNDDDAARAEANLYFHRIALSRAVGVELFERNPIKYSNEYPLTSLIGQVSGLGVSALTLSWMKFTNGVKEAADATDKKVAVETTCGCKATCGSKPATGAVMRWFHEAPKGMRWLIIGTLGFANVVKVIIWATEERDDPGLD
jgi:hypothetical protein